METRAFDQSHRGGACGRRTRGRATHIPDLAARHRDCGSRARSCSSASAEATAAARRSPPSRPPAPRSSTSPLLPSTSPSGGASGSSSCSAPRCSSAGRSCSAGRRSNRMLAVGIAGSLALVAAVGAVAHDGAAVRPRARRSRGDRAARPRLGRPRADHRRGVRLGAPRAQPHHLPNAACRCAALGLALTIALTAWALTAVGAA